MPEGEVVAGTVSNYGHCQVHGPRGPRPLYYMLNHDVRVYGLTHTLSVKFVQVGPVTLARSAAPAVY